MSQITNATFGAATTAKEVAASYSDGIAGKTILITGVNKDGLGYATAEAFVSLTFSLDALVSC
jgi:hypothetical protein